MGAYTSLREESENVCRKSPHSHPGWGQRETMAELPGLRSLASAGTDLACAMHALGASRLGTLTLTWLRRIAAQVEPPHWHQQPNMLNHSANK